MNQKEQQAIDLLLEDLHTNHHEIRVIAKNLDCETELEKCRDDVIDYLQSLKQ